MLPNNTLSQFRKPGLSCLPVLYFISIVTLILFISSTNVYSAQVTLAWNPNSESDLAGYKQYYGNSSGIYDNSVDVGNQTSYTVLNLVSGQDYFFAVTAYDTSGNESDYSSEFLYSVPLTDTTLPAITSVSANGDPTKVTVVFSEPVVQTSAENIANYIINNGITISGASLGADLKTVTLTTSPHSEGITYTLTVNNIQDRAGIPNVIVPNTIKNYTFAAQLVTSNLTVSSGKSYEVVQNGLSTSALVYIDRTFTFNTVPALVKDATYIRTANGDKSSSVTAFLTFDINQDVYVYVAHDDRITTKPLWMSSFTDTGDDLVTTDTILSIFSKDFSAGTITLGGNEGGGSSSMYTVIIVGQGTGPIADTTLHLQLRIIYRQQPSLHLRLIYLGMPQLMMWE